MLKLVTDAENIANRNFCRKTAKRTDKENPRVGTYESFQIVVKRYIYILVNVFYKITLGYLKSRSKLSSNLSKWKGQLSQR